MIADPKQKASERVSLLEIVGQTKPEGGATKLVQLLNDAKSEVRHAALYALQAYADVSLGKQVLDQWNKLPKDSREAAFAMLTSRAAWSKQLLDQIDAGRLDKKSVPVAFIRRALLHSDDELKAMVKKHYGEVQGAVSEKMKQEIRRLTEVIGVGSGNPYTGKKLFANSCGKCHVLFASGGKIGPDLTSFKRDDLSRMLVNVVNPSIEIREGYENHAVLTADGRALSGFVEEQDAQVVVLKAADGQRTVIERDDIEAMRALPTSVMPEGLLNELSEQQIRDLFAYLRATQPLP